MLAERADICGCKINECEAKINTGQDLNTRASPGFFKGGCVF